MMILQIFLGQEEKCKGVHRRDAARRRLRVCEGHGGFRTWRIGYGRRNRFWDVRAVTAESQPAVAFAFAKAMAGSGHGESDIGGAIVSGT
jgi:hypothetical protein